MTVPTIAFLLLGGVVSDRLDRRKVMLGADLGRGLVVGVIALISMTVRLDLWHLVVLVAAYGAAAAFFGPAFDAITPEILPARDLAQANALDHLVRSVALRLAGPVTGGVLIDAVGVGAAFALDAATYGVSALAVIAMRARTAARRPWAVTSAPASRVSDAMRHLGDVCERCHCLPAVHGAGRGAAAVPGQEPA
jgi:MFS family permease